ncbi:MAG: DUF47 family protein [Bryobacterales bacterium]|nr:DUF47 family protein [Bryobacterales bacterium]
MGLLPRDERFYQLFVEQSERIVACATALTAAFDADAPDWARLIERIDELSRAGDDCLHHNVELLAQSFITPFDPEDIHRLAVALNALLDGFSGLGERCRIYQLGQPSLPMRELAKACEHGAEALHTAVGALAKEQDAPAALAEIRRLELDGDRIYRTAMRELFASNADTRTLITHPQIYDRLETATDRFEAVACLIEEIRLKNS